MGLIIIVVCAGIVVQVFSLFDYKRYGLWPVFFLKGREKDRIYSLLSVHPYFRNLSAEGQKKFATRVYLFRSRMFYVGMNGLEVDDEMEITIAASAIQLTFGLDDFLFDRFTHIYVYPKAFYVEALDAELRGGVSPRGKIYLSWQNLKEGNADSSDGINLGLHEMTHALKISAVFGDLNEEFIEELRAWVKDSENWIKDVTPELAVFLREYGLTNTHEFFSVCVEHFFEQPKLFKEQLPLVYGKLKELLNQDPMNVNMDYRLPPPMYNFTR